MMRILLLLFLGSIEALVPLGPSLDDDNECALYLHGPARTSAFDYNVNLLRGNLNYEGQHTCITYEAINQAYLEARKRIRVSRPKGDWGPEDYATVGELTLDISSTLARMYGLTYEEIEKGLPLIDTSKTLIREVCPPIFSHVECRPGKYRRYDGLCNNLKNPTWGATMAPFQRLLSPLFADGINAPRVAKSGNDLPLSRIVSRTMHPDEGFHDHAGTVMVIAWGQFMDHDYTLTGTPLDPRNRNDPEECCDRPPHRKHPYCNEIRIPEDDYFYRLFGVKCMNFVRAFPSPRPGCKLGSRVPFNTLTGVIDGNTVYGVTEKFGRKLRTGYAGLLRMNPVFEEYGLKDLLPLKLDIPDEGCTRPNPNMYCFEGGEIRVNEQLVLTCMHTLMAREHNRVAKGLAVVNAHWDDETIFQEARRIVIAEIQHITYNEFLPILLGKDVMEKFGLLLTKNGYWDGYDSNVNPDVIDAFSSAAFRFGHSLLPTAIERWSKAHRFIASKRLSELIRKPFDLYRAGVFDEYIMGLMNQVAQAMDDSITQEVTNHLFKKIGAKFGMDLVSLNMQRGREFGIPGYMEFRKFCGLPEAHSFQELLGTMANETIRKYESIFESPGDVDLWSGGVSEKPLPGSMLGPTFACVIATQFSFARRGDRFWFELPNQPSSFTPEQLVELRKARLARIICDNTDIIDTTQVYPMVLPDHELNPRVPCKSGILPSIDFSKWAELPQNYPQPIKRKQYVTEASLVNATDASDEECNLNNLSEGTSNTSATSNVNNTHQLNVNITSQPDKDKEKVTTNFVLKYLFKNKDKTPEEGSNTLSRHKRQTELQTIILDHLKSQEELYNKTKKKVSKYKEKSRSGQIHDNHENPKQEPDDATEKSKKTNSSSKKNEPPEEYYQKPFENFHEYSDFDYLTEGPAEKYSEREGETTTQSNLQESIKGGTYNSDSAESEEEFRIIVTTEETVPAKQIEENYEHERKPEQEVANNSGENSSNESSGSTENDNEDKKDEQVKDGSAFETTGPEKRNKSSRSASPITVNYGTSHHNIADERPTTLFDTDEEVQRHENAHISKLTNQGNSIPTVKPVQYETHFYPNNDYLDKRIENENTGTSNQNKESQEEERVDEFVESENFKRQKDENSSNEGGEDNSAEVVSKSQEDSARLKLKDEYEKIPPNYRHDQESFLKTPKTNKNPEALLVSTPNQYFYFDQPSVKTSSKSKIDNTLDRLRKPHRKTKKYNSREQHSEEQDHPKLNNYATTPSTADESTETEAPFKRPHKLYVLKKIKKRPISPPVHEEQNSSSKEVSSEEEPPRERLPKIAHEKNVPHKPPREESDSREYSSSEERARPNEKVKEHAIRYHSGESDPQTDDDLKMKFDQLGIPEIHLPEKITEYSQNFKEPENNGSKKLDVADDDFFYKKYKYNPDHDDNDSYSSKFTYDPSEGKRKRKEKSKEYLKYKDVSADDEENSPEKTNRVSQEEDSSKLAEPEDIDLPANVQPAHDSVEVNDEQEPGEEENHSGEVSEEDTVPKNKKKSTYKVEEGGEEEIPEEEEEDPHESYHGDFDDFRDRGEDLYEKFVQENFNKMGSFLERSQKLFRDPTVMSTVQKLVKSAKGGKYKRKKKPKKNYRWSEAYYL